MKERPSIAVSIAMSLQAEAAEKGFWAYIPYVFGACLIAGFVSAEFVPDEFWSDERWDVSTAVFAGLLAFNGLLLSLGWFAFSKIYEILANDRLGKMLTANNLLGVHLAFIDISHLVLIAASVLSVGGLVGVLAGVPVWIDGLVFGSCLGFTLYGLARAFSATRMMNDLVWEQAYLDREGVHLTAIEGTRNAKS